MEKYVNIIVLDTAKTLTAMVLIMQNKRLFHRRKYQSPKA